MSLSIIVPVSGGLESTYLLQKAMSMNAKITVVFINVVGVAEGMVGELLSMNKTLDYFRSKDLDRKQYPGEIVEVLYYLAKPYLNVLCRNGYHGETQTRQTNNINQQISIIMALTKVRSALVANSRGVESPTVLIGWLKEDSSDVSYDDYDFSAAEYQEFLNLPVTLGRLSNSDRLAIPFRAPLWEMTKQQVWSKLDPALEPFIIPNGWCKYEEENSWVIHTPFDNKKQEYVDAKIPIESEYTLQIEETDLGFFVKRLLKMVTWKDLDLPQEARNLIRLVNEQPFIDPRENFIYESRLANLKDNFKDAVKDLHRAASRFEWPVPPVVEEPILEDQPSSVKGDVIVAGDEQVSERILEDRPTVSVALRKHVAERFLGDKDV